MAKVEIEMTKEHRVIVWDKPYIITVDQKSKSVWVAVGDYLGESIRVQDQSEGAAIKRWCEAARYKGA